MQDAAALPLDELDTSNRRRSPAARFFRSLLRRKLAMIGITYILFFYGAGLLAPVLAPHDPNAITLGAEARYLSPSAEHWLGTDAYGRDMASRTLFAMRTTLLFTVAVFLTGGLFLGLGLGLLAGYRGGWVDTAVMRIGEVLSGLPTIILIIAIAAAFRTRINDMAFWLKDNTLLGDDARVIVDFVIIVGVTVPFAWVGSARIVRSQALALREADFIVAAELLGASTWRIITRHLLPGVIPLFVVGLSGGMASIAGTEVALSFLGLGVNAPTSSFGTMISEGAGLTIFREYPHMLLSASFPIVLFLFSWNLLGDALVDLLEPRGRSR